MVVAQPTSTEQHEIPGVQAGRCPRSSICTQPLHWDFSLTKLHIDCVQIFPINVKNSIAEYKNARIRWFFLQIQVSNWRVNFFIGFRDKDPGDYLSGNLQNARRKSMMLNENKNWTKKVKTYFPLFLILADNG